MRNQRVDLVEVADRQNAIIRIQSQAINELFKALAQHTDDDLDGSNIVKMINTAADIRRDIKM